MVVKDSKPTVEHRRTITLPRAESPLALRIGEYVSNLANRRESGGTAQSAWWTTTMPSFVNDLIECAVEDFEATATAAAALLVAAPPTARSGLVVLTRSVEDGVRSVAALKLVLSEEQLARFDDEATEADPIVEQRIPNVLPKPGDVKKGALVPHPTGAAHARVIDEQLKDPAGYWLTWLGLTARMKEPALAKLTVATVHQVIAELSSEAAATTAMASAVADSAAKTAPVSSKEIATTAAKAADLQPAAVWKAAVALEPALAGDRLDITPEVLKRVDLVIALDGGVSIRGPLSSLGGRYRIRAARKKWVTEVDSKTKPDVGQQVKPGGARSS